LPDGVTMLQQLRILDLPERMKLSEHVTRLRRPAAT
jgi:hypothetical protein